MEKFVAAMFLLCAVGLGIASLATTHWQDINGVNAHYGLFQSCLTVNDLWPGQKGMVMCANNLENSLIKDVFKRNDWYIPIVAVHVCAVTLAFIGTILWVTLFCQGGTGLKASTVFISLIACACFLGSVFMWKFRFVGKSSNSSHGYSFWCAVSATICMIIGTLLEIVACIRQRNYVPVATT